MVYPHITLCFSQIAKRLKDFLRYLGNGAIVFKDNRPGCKVKSRDKTAITDLNTENGFICNANGN